MRRLLAMAAALALAACKVDVEGARCRVPGATEDCPSGQACGNDLRCSARALACETAGTRCVIGTAFCAGNDDKERVERCSGAVDPACGAWVVEDCREAGLECGEHGPAAACECKPFTDDFFWADPVAGSPADEAPFATGAVSPPACRFGRLGDALAAARVLADADGDPVVQAFGTAGVPVVFGDAASGETFPLEVAARVTVAGAGTDAPTIVRAEGATDGPLVHVQGWLTGFRIERAPVAPAEGEAAGATGTGIAATCGDFNLPYLDDVAVDGGGTLTTGIAVVGGACGAYLFDVEVSRVTGTALDVVANPDAPVTVKASTFRDSGSGIRATGGKLTLGAELESEVQAADAVVVSGNAGEGVVLTGGPSSTLDVQILGATIEANGGTGLVLDSVSAASKLAVRGCVVHANGLGPKPRRYGSAERPVGGAFISQVSLSTPLSFTANRLWANAGDQLAFESNGAWSIAPGTTAESCPLANVFACVDEGSRAVGITSPGTVNARYSVWPNLPVGTLAGPGVTADPYCETQVGGAPALPTCPDP